MILTRCSVLSLRTLTRLPVCSIHTTLRRLNKDFAFVFDIDGVLIRGKKPILQAKPALEILNQHKIPYILMTNGGGVLEKVKADEVTHITGIDPPISPLQVVQSHTPIKALALNYGYNRVLVIGGDGDNAREVAKDYGFQDIILPIDIVNENPAVSPHHRFTEEDFRKYAKPIDVSKPIDAILVLNDPRDMGTDIQIVQDLLNSEVGVLGTKRNIHHIRNLEEPAVPIIFSNNDYLYANDYKLPRFGQGEFRIITEKLYKVTNNLKKHQKLESFILGKPYKIQYDFAHHVLIDWHNKLIKDEHLANHEQVLPQLGTEPEDTPFKKIYMVGDNPESDIKGANDNGWESVLLRTGVYKDDDYDTMIAKPTVGVFNNVEDAVIEILESNGIKV
ncbi:hypothetical protein Cantr_05121 [Candida viswanathii]|uniref:CDP-alcohol phosphatidyltransferase class-I family protein C22A12.08c n=1 Tax=Candida viswanathii TaxID=5486 RepID=A0A367XR73_9ASCO|nr:hypothetical protein Cantr_05121 [Candida viswanathii]